MHSPLVQSLTRDGKTVQIDIYEGSEGGWLLEVIDEHGNSNVWDDPFQSDRDALDEALRTIEEDAWCAMKRFAEIPRDQVGRVTMEIARLGKSGLEINNPSAYSTVILPPIPR
ncbi:MAG: hypothetical protein Q8O64_12335 [Sideroxyarcus sp.]|nr:hypothetical protein [Sideroxyarcus sp.]